MLGHEYALKKELLKTISSSTFKKEKEREGGNLVCVLRYEKKKEWEIKIESDFQICNYRNGKFLNGRGCEWVALSFVLLWSRGITAGI